VTRLLCGEEKDCDEVAAAGDEFRAGFRVIGSPGGIDGTEAGVLPDCGKAFPGSGWCTRRLWVNVSSAPAAEEKPHGGAAE